MATTRANELANFIGAPSFTGDLTVDSDFSANTITATTTVTGATVTSTGTVSGATVTSTGTVSGATVTSTGDVNDSVGDVRTPRYTHYEGGDLTVSDEGVLLISSSSTLSTLTIGTPVSGTIISVYNNLATSITLACGSQVSSMRIGADNNNTHNATLTLGARSMTTITILSSAANLAVVTGTDVT